LAINVTVVIPLFNKQKAIERSISSVLLQSLPPNELIIVDDGSTDNSLKIARKGLQRASNQIRCKIISQENAGVSVARNRGADEASSDYIAFLDADDEWLPDYLEELQELALAFPAAGVLTLRCAKINSNGQLVPEPSPLPEPFFGIVHTILEAYRKGYGIIHTSSIALKKDTWERSEKFPVGARKSQDMFLWLKLCMTESFAHSSRTLSIWHDDYSGVPHRKGIVPYHFTYFLGTEEGKRYLNNKELLKFLGSNLLVHIGGHRLNKDNGVVAKLRQFSAVLPLQIKLKCWVSLVIPLWTLHILVWWRRRSRGLRR
jgi:glycosyltransferase involved in cell wall biosynthesis